jgi:hypothetical protein
MRRILSVALVFLAASIESALAQTYPSRPITMMVPFPPAARPSLPSYCHSHSPSPSLDRTTPARRRGRPIYYPQRYPAVARVYAFAALSMA